MKHVFATAKLGALAQWAGQLARALLAARRSTPLKAKSDFNFLHYSGAKRKINRVFIHCSASDNPSHDDIEVIRKWHLDRGFNDVGYHFFIQNSGRVQLGRSIEKAPAAQKGHNHGTIAICLHGLTKFNGAQKRALINLCKEINAYHDGAVTFHGHDQVSNKSCPVVDYRAILALDPSGKLGL